MKNKIEKDKGTFVIKILNQSNSTWQGTVTWVEKAKTQNFRSALELIKIIDGAISWTEVSEDKGGSYNE